MQQTGELVPSFRSRELRQSSNSGGQGVGGNGGGECWGVGGRREVSNSYQLGATPSAFSTLYPQGSSKLEKAEVLQMTVDHLKMLHASGGTGNSALLPRELLTLQVLRPGALGIKG